MLMSCVNCLYDLCEVIVCNEEGTIKVPQVANLNGDYTLVLEFLGTAKPYARTFAQGDMIEFNACKLNENYCYEGYILDPLGNLLVINYEYSGLKFCTKQLHIC